MIFTDTFERLIKLCEELGVNTTEITKETTFDDLGFDSLDLVEILMAIEEEFGIEIPEEDEKKIKSLGDLTDYLSEK